MLHSVRFVKLFLVQRAAQRDVAVAEFIERAWSRRVEPQTREQPSPARP
jgi:hypothetical protein